MADGCADCESRTSRIVGFREFPASGKGSITRIRVWRPLPGLASAVATSRSVDNSQPLKLGIPGAKVGKRQLGPVCPGFAFVVVVVVV